MKAIINSKWILFFLPTLLIMFCGKRNDNSAKYIKKTIYEDEILREIAVCKSTYNSTELIQYLTNENPEYKKAAALACASINDTVLFDHLLSMLTDYNEEVRIAASYSLGEIGTLRPKTEQLLIDFFEAEHSQKVRMNILEAIGKCGSTYGLDYLSDLNIENDKILLLTGQILGLTRFAIRNSISNKSITKVISLLDISVPQKVRIWASIYLTKAQVDLTKFYPSLKQILANRGDSIIKNNIISTLRKIKNDEITNVLDSILKNNSTYAENINRIKNLKEIDTSSYKETLPEVFKNELEILSKLKQNHYNNKYIDTAFINWDLIRSVSANQEVRVTTTKGEFIIELEVNQMPVSISSFLQLIDKKYYHNTPITKSDLGKCIFTGYNSKNMDTTITSTYFPLEKSSSYFTKTSVGISTSENKIMPVQCFITTDFVPEFDGKFANIGFVTSGMEVIYSLEAGDSIKNFKLLQ